MSESNWTKIQRLIKRGATVAVGLAELSKALKKLWDASSWLKELI
jgi:hypothetical protein